MKASDDNSDAGNAVVIISIIKTKQIFLIIYFALGVTILGKLRDHMPLSLNTFCMNK